MHLDDKNMCVAGTAHFILFNINMTVVLYVLLGPSLLPGAVEPKKSSKSKGTARTCCFLVGSFKLCVVIETITLLSSFLPCIPLNSVMKSKLPFNKKIEGVFGKTVWSDWKMWKKREGKRKASMRTSGAGSSQPCSLAGHFAFPVLPCYLISRRQIAISHSQLWARRGDLKK